MTTLAEILRGVECGVFPAPDLGLTVVPAPSPREACVVAFTGHIAADVDPAWIDAMLLAPALTDPTERDADPPASRCFWHLIRRLQRNPHLWITWG